MFKAICLLCSLCVCAPYYLHATSAAWSLPPLRDATSRSGERPDQRSGRIEDSRRSRLAIAQQLDLTWRGDLAVTQAQVTSDGTVNTQVTTNGNSAEITGGETRGDNLFYSFQDFSVPTNNEAFFNNANDIANIFSRVTVSK